MFWARACVRAYKILRILRILPFLPVLLPCFPLSRHSAPPLPSFHPPFLLSFIPSFLPSFAVTSVDAAGGEPGRSWTAARRPGPHRGPCAGGGLAREAAPEAGPGSPAPRLSRAPARTPQSLKSH